MQWKSAYDQAVKRDEADAQKLRDNGWENSGGSWVGPTGGGIFDGPGSFVSVLGHLEAVARERGIAHDIDTLSAILQRMRR